LSFSIVVRLFAAAGRLIGTACPGPAARPNARPPPVVAGSPEIAPSAIISAVPPAYRSVAVLTAALLALVFLVSGSTAAPTSPQRRTTGPDPSVSTVVVTPSTAASPSPTAAAGAHAPPPGATPAGPLPPVVDHGPREAPRVALTFDADMTDGMLAQLARGTVRSYANITLIELLERERVPATFFLTGKWVQRYPELTHRLADNPRFELANHSYGHQGFTRNCYSLGQVPPGQMTEDVAKTFHILEPYGGRQTRYFRFPGLCHDQAALAAMRPLGLTVVDGDVVSGDPFARDWRPIVDAVLSKVQPGSIVVMHVTEANAQYTDEALPHILAGLRAKGLTPVTLSELLAD
jgi:peptidoglycan/xylan/chitin deacetylase (PgdA/CDA1 family)